MYIRSTDPFFQATYKSQVGRKNTLSSVSKHSGKLLWMVERLWASRSLSYHLHPSEKAPSPSLLQSSLNGGVIIVNTSPL